MSRLFEHSHRELAGRVEVVGVRVSGDLAHVQLGSRTLPASFILVRRMGGVWRIDSLLGVELP